MVKHSERINRNLENWKSTTPEMRLTSALVIQRCIWISRLTTGRLTEVSRRHGLANRGDYECLSILFHARPLLVSPNELAKELEISASGITGRIDRLEALGLLDRQPDPEDRRGVRLVISSDGVTTVNAIFLESLAKLEALVSGLTREQVNGLADLLEVVLKQAES